MESGWMQGSKLGQLIVGGRIPLFRQSNISELKGPLYDLAYVVPLKVYGYGS